MRLKHCLGALAFMALLIAAMSVLVAVDRAHAAVPAPCWSTDPALRTVFARDAAGRRYCAHFDGEQIVGDRHYLETRP